MKRSWILLICAAGLIAVLPGTGTALTSEPGKVAAQQQRALRHGDKGERVAALQRQLKAAGFEPGPVDGIFGQRTLAAVRRAQTRLGVQVDGLAGSQTAAALERHAGNGAAAAATGAQVTPPHVKLRQLEDAPPAGAETGPGEGARRFALTFNGEPDPALLPRLLAVLKQNGMQATFFLRGETAVRTPDMLAQIIAGGHEIGSNGYADLDMTQITEQMRRAQLRMAQQAITDAAGTAPVYFRPPGGRYNEALAQTAEQMRLSIVLWTNVGATDIPEVDAAALVDRLTGSVYPGAVMMLHADRANAVAALEQLLPALRTDGYASVTLSRLNAEQKSTVTDGQAMRN